MLEHSCIEILNLLLLTVWLRFYHPGFLGSCNLTDQSLPGAEPYKVNTSFSCDYHGGNDSKLECNLTKEENVGCYFQACLIDNTTESCILYTLKNCSRNGSTSCADEETPADEGN